MPSLALGPILRYIGTTEATVWVEADGPCEVEVLGRTARTFSVDGRHYAIVPIEGLDPGRSYEYEVRLDGERAWPDPESELPPSAIRTIRGDGRLRLAFGSCRMAAPHEPPFTRRRASDPRGLGVDALHALALRAARSHDDERPDVLLMLGDQIYADQPPIRTMDFIRAHEVDPRAPADQIEDLTEYAAAYRIAWGEPLIRWLLATVPSAMIFDDHEIHDEWKISKAWVEEMRSKEWYDRRVTAGLAAYWIYQHLGNLSPRELADSELLARALEADDAGPLLRDFARDADRQSERSRWSFSRDLGRTRLVVLDSRGGRSLEPGARRIMNPAEWRWLEEQVAGDFDHLLLASSIPLLVSHGLHHLEAWSERLCDGAWGERAARLGERLRQRGNMGHWAAFERSFRELAELLEAVAAGRLGAPPGSIVVLSGDVHHCYLAEVGFRRGSGARSPTWQAVCSGLRKQLDPGEKASIKLASSRAGRAVGRTLARAVGVPEPPIAWRLAEGPVYENQVATLELAPGEATMRVESAAGADWRDPRLHTAFERRLVHRSGTPR